jgi:hypothetical protein
MLLKYIYTFFIGILLATFIGVGIAAFYEGPKQPEFPIEDTYPTKLPETPTASVSAEEATLERERAVKHDKAYREFSTLNRVYSRNVSIITTIASVLLLVISLTMLKKLDLLSDGLLLGGLFTQLYSILRGFESQDNKFRFVVVTIGLITSLVVGYMRFIRKKSP